MALNLSQVDGANGFRLGGTEVSFDAPGAALGTRLATSFLYEVSDGRGGSDSASVAIDFAQNAISLANLDGTNGFQLIGGAASTDYTSSAVAGAGDFNGDGIDDLIIG